MDVGVDVGGTFTDFVAFQAGRVVSTKIPSTPVASSAVLKGLRELGATAMAHGTTVATNAILERRGARTAFVTTKGFEDLLTIGRQNRPSLYDLRIARPPPPVERDLCFGLAERVDASGRVRKAPSAREVDRVARAIRRSGADSVAIALLFSFLRRDHERRLAKALRGLPVSVSHEVLAEFREYERSSTTVLDAYIKPLVARYLEDLADGFGRDFQVMKSSGGTVLHRQAVRRPVDIVLSGPAGGVAAAVALSRRTGRRDLVTFDMGGTSADLSAIVRGRPSWTRNAMIDTFPIAIPVVDIESVGAGGGSLAWVDSGGALRVGPQSAGADPGPMAYGRGGLQPTVTDADLVAGILGPSLLGGRLPLDADRAREGLASLAARLGHSLDETVMGVQRIVRATMAKSMRLVLARRGLDPRDFTILAFGGAGPMHAHALAREIGAPRVLIPFLPGAFSAYGILISDARLEYSRSLVRPLEGSASDIRRILASFEARTKHDLAAQGLPSGKAILEASVDVRFRGQSYEINVPARGDLASAFRRAHRRRYGYARPGEPIEVVTIRLAVRVPRRTWFPPPPGDVTPRASIRRCLFEGTWTDTKVLHRSSLPTGFRADGPAIVEEEHATTAVPPGASFAIDDLGLLEIEVAR